MSSSSPKFFLILKSMAAANLKATTTTNLKALTITNLKATTTNLKATTTCLKPTPTCIKPTIIKSNNIRIQAKNKIKCEICKKIFSSKGSLKKHVIKFHSKKTEYLASFKFKGKLERKFSCSFCDKKFMHPQTLKNHMKNHSEYDYEEHKKSLKYKKHKCAICHNYENEPKNVIEHYKNIHNISFEEAEYNFQSEEEFNKWKTYYESETCSTYVVKFTTSGKHHKGIRFKCHRSGTYRPSGKGLRHLKSQGSNKINGFCPASITFRKYDDGKCEAKVIKTHVGHELELGHLNLTKSERESIAEKIAAKMSFDDILDEIAGSESSNKRLQLLTRKDLHNIGSSFKLHSSVKHSNDSVSFESWINEMRGKGDDVLFYKPQGCLLDEWPELKMDDLVLVIMTEPQCEILKKYGSNCVCIDRIFDLHGYDFELITCLVLDDIHQGFPCSFLITNRSDKDILYIFYYSIKTKLNTQICPKIFMSDMVQSFYDAWLEVMLPPKFSLYCAWHIDHAWRKNLSKISNKDKQLSTYKNLRAIMELTDVKSFNIMVTQFCNKLYNDPDTFKFYKYFKDNFMTNIPSWAYCNRLDIGLNAIMNLEKIHKTLKCTFIKGNDEKRLDKGINAILRFVRDRCGDRLAFLNKGKLTNNLKMIRNRHKASEKLNINFVVKCNDGWNVACVKQIDFNFIKKVREKCECQLTCLICKTCVHQFTCSCEDSSVKHNMCKHIHLVCRFIQKEIDIGTELTSPNVLVEVNHENSLTVTENSQTDEIDFFLDELTSESVNIKSEFEEDKQNLMNKLYNLVDVLKTMTSSEELEVVNKFITPIEPALAALMSSKNIGS